MFAEEHWRIDPRGRYDFAMKSPFHHLHPLPPAIDTGNCFFFFFFGAHFSPISQRFGFFYGFNPLTFMTLFSRSLFLGEGKTQVSLETIHMDGTRILNFPQFLSANMTVMPFLKVGSGPFGWGVYVFPLP